MMFARLDFRRFLVFCSGDISDDESEEKPSVAICGGSIYILTGIYASLNNASHTAIDLYAWSRDHERLEKIDGKIDRRKSCD